MPKQARMLRASTPCLKGDPAPQNNRNSGTLALSVYHAAHSAVNEVCHCLKTSNTRGEFPVCFFVLPGAASREKPVGGSWDFYFKKWRKGL